MFKWAKTLLEMRFEHVKARRGKEELFMQPTTRRSQVTQKQISIRRKHRGNCRRVQEQYRLSNGWMMHRAVVQEQLQNRCPRSFSHHSVCARVCVWWFCYWCLRKRERGTGNVAHKALLIANSALFRLASLSVSSFLPRFCPNSPFPHNSIKAGELWKTAACWRGLLTALFWLIFYHASAIDPAAHPNEEDFTL